jgi:D-alanyl-D-alanine carboxypeptidase/D-alanyl-D-alanine-endopeptidase (penicillin-binding protein 4)
MKQLLFTLLTLLSVVLSAQTSSQQILSDFQKNNSVRNAALSIYVADSKTGEVLFSTEPQLCLTPASVQKLITSATALEIMRGDYRFKTIVWANGEVSNGKLTGDLVITGGGDPTLGSENFCDVGEKKKFLSDWVHLIKKAGIDTIIGNIVADPSIFSDQDVPNSWLWEDVGNHYGAASSGISVYDNIFELIFNVPALEGQAAEVVKVQPEIPGLLLKNEVLSSPKKSDNANVFGSPFDTYRVIKGTLPAGLTNFIVKAAVPDPALLLASELKKALNDSFVTVTGDIEKKRLINQKEIASDKILIDWPSPALSEIVEKMNKESINLYAETLLKHIGLAVSNEGSTTAGTDAIKDFWVQKDIDTQNLFMADGSGLSRQNAFTAKTLVDILVFMKNKSQWFDTFQNSIPVTGIEGTQKNYFQDSILKGKARAKTGSMTRVRSMAGYMTTQNGKEITFAIMVNNYSGNSASLTRNIENFMESLYQTL